MGQSSGTRQILQRKWVGTMTEIWKPWIHDPRYLISSFGQVRGIKGQLLRLILLGPKGNQYQTFSWWDASKQRGQPIRVHIAVLETFVCLRPTGKFGCHRDGNTLNNCLNNLRWDTRSANTRDWVESKTGIRSLLPEGVSYEPYNSVKKPYAAKIYCGKMRHLGYYATIADAVQAIEIARQ